MLLLVTIGLMRSREEQERYEQQRRKIHAVHWYENLNERNYLETA